MAVSAPATERSSPRPPTSLPLGTSSSSAGPSLCCGSGLNDLLLAYGLPKTTIARLMSGSYDKAETPDERLLKDKVYFRFTDEPGDALYPMTDAARDDDRVVKYRPRFLIVKNEPRLLAADPISSAAQRRAQAAFGAADLLSLSAMWTGRRIVRALSASARAIAWRIHQVA